MPLMVSCLPRSTANSLAQEKATGHLVARTKKRILINIKTDTVISRFQLYDPVHGCSIATVNAVIYDLYGRSNRPAIMLTSIL